MKLVTAKECLDFLGQSAPRPWIKRMLSWMIVNQEIQAYFAKGRIVPRSLLFSILSYEQGFDPGAGVDERDKLIRRTFNSAAASPMLGKRLDDLIEGDATEWGERDEPHAISAGIFLFAEDVDWEEGTLRAQIDDDMSSKLEFLFWDHDEHLASAYPKAEYHLSLSGMCFSLDSIEMLQPQGDRSAVVQVGRSMPKSRLGRPPKWDWEAALEHVISHAQSVDGLPTGPGAQAEIERILSAWFIQQEDEAPAESLIRTRAQRIMRALESRKAKN